MVLRISSNGFSVNNAATKYRHLIIPSAVRDEFFMLAIVMSCLTSHHHKQEPAGKLWLEDKTELNANDILFNIRSKRTRAKRSLLQIENTHGIGL